MFNLPCLHLLDCGRKHQTYQQTHSSNDGTIKRGKSLDKKNLFNDLKPYDSMSTFEQTSTNFLYKTLASTEQIRHMYILPSVCIIQTIYCIIKFTAWKPGYPHSLKSKSGANVFIL